MDDHTDDRDAGPPPVGTPEELEEALKWLEELTARQGKPAEPSPPASSASLDSPFRGLIDNEDGDLPDWLREVPSTPGQEGLEETEPESRLDWLAKMAQRESIEELPTLEWRRLSEPSQSAIMAAHGQIDLPQPDETEEERDESDEATDVASADVAAETDEAAENWATDLAPVTPFLDVADEAEGSPTADINLDEIEDQVADEAYAVGEGLQMEEAKADEEAPTPDEPAAYDESDSDLPPIDDLDAAMAWIEELAVSQETPLEDLPSVADRALASQLMAEAGIPLSASPLDEIGSDSDMLDSLTPPHPFIEEEDFADTVVLVETLAAEQNAGQGPIDEVSPPFEQADEPDKGDNMVVEGIVLGAITSFDESVEAPSLDAPADEISFEEAMALLDEMAAEPSEAGGESEFAPVELEVDAESLPEWVGEPVMEIVETTTVVEVETEVDPEPESASADEAWGTDDGDDTAGDLHAVVPAMLIADAEPEYLNGRGYSPLEEALQSLDAIALPPGKSMDDIDASLRTAQMAPWRDVDSALTWLESTLVVEMTSNRQLETETEVESLIAQMPEDPDAVLAWLEQMAGEDTSLPAVEAEAELEPPSRVTTGQPEPLIEELAEVDLLNMPEDPDEAMAWLEGLAREATTPIEEAPTSIEEAQTVAFFHPNELVAEDTVAEDAPEIVIGAAEPEWQTAEDAPDETTDDGETAELDEAITVVLEAEDADAAEAVVDIAIVEAELAGTEDLVDEAAESVADEAQAEAPTADEPEESEALIVTIDADDSAAGEDVIDIAIAEAELAQTEDSMTDAADWLESDAQVEAPLVVEVATEDVATEDVATEDVVAEDTPEEEPAAPREEESLSWLDLLKPLD